MKFIIKSLGLALGLLASASLAAKPDTEHPVETMGPELQNHFIAILMQQKREADAKPAPAAEAAPAPTRSRESVAGFSDFNIKANLSPGYVRLDLASSNWEKLRKVTFVTYYVDGRSFSGFQSQSVGWWQIGPGSHIVTAHVQFSDSTPAEDVWPGTSFSTPYDCCPPTVTTPVVTFDNNNIYLSTTVSDDLGILGVSWSMNGKQVATGTSATIARSTVPNGGTFSFYATVFDYYQKSAVSGTVTVTVPGKPQVTTIRSTVRNWTTTYRTTVNGTVKNATRVEIYLDGVFMKTVTPTSTGTFSAILTTSYIPGYAEAKAYDTLGQSDLRGVDIEYIDPTLPPVIQ